MVSNMENIEDTAENWENGSLGMDEKYVKKSKITMEDIAGLAAPDLFRNGYSEAVGVMANSGRKVSRR